MGMQEEIGRMVSLGLLDRLLSDKTTKAPILWGTDAYSAWGPGYGRDREITVEMLVQEPFRLMSRAEKDRDAQAERTKAHAEVFTPLRIVRQMNDFADAEWFGRPDVFLRDGAPTERVLFPAGKDWREYVDSRRLEITCGEAPYLVSRYDVSTGEAVPLARRVGMLDRKLRVVNENAATEEEWFAWALRAFQATYGYEFQGDNVLIARLNLLMTFEEYLAARWNRQPTEKEYAAVTGVIPWNIWQMDGLTGTIPYCRRAAGFRQEDLFASIGMAGPEEEASRDVRPGCRVKNWRGGGSVEFSELPTRGKRGMKFDFIIGNPPYQDETVGDQKTFAPPIYHVFLDAAYKLSDKVELIHPARFLFNAGSTPKVWNEKMLADPHFKVLLYEQNSANFFPNTDVKGGGSGFISGC